MHCVVSRAAHRVSAADDINSIDRRVLSHPAVDRRILQRQATMAFLQPIAAADLAHRPDADAQPRVIRMLGHVCRRGMLRDRPLLPLLGSIRHHKASRRRAMVTMFRQWVMVHWLHKHPLVRAGAAGWAQAPWLASPLRCSSRRSLPSRPGSSSSYRAAAGSAPRESLCPPSATSRCGAALVNVLRAMGRAPRVAMECPGVHHPALVWSAVKLYSHLLALYSHLRHTSEIVAERATAGVLTEVGNTIHAQCSVQYGFGLNAVRIGRLAVIPTTQPLAYSA
jgi:hypothetical protein